MFHALQKHQCTAGQLPLPPIYSDSKESSSHHVHTTAAVRGMESDFPRSYQEARNRVEFISPRTRSCVFTARHPPHPQHSVKPIERGPQTLCKAQRSKGLQLKPLEASAAKKKCCHRALRFAQTVLKGKKKRSPACFRNWF